MPPSYVFFNILMGGSKDADIDPVFTVFSYTANLPILEDAQRLLPCSTAKLALSFEKPYLSAFRVLQPF